MNENEKLIQEHFFKKKKESVADKMKKKYGYEPLDARKTGQPGFGSIMDTGLAVTDSKEAGKRVVSALGASLGVNSIKNMASKSIKSFPIIISENVEPETSVMIKRVMEEQYAEYISLLISNQIVDISAFKTSEDEGNIAIQALDIVSPEDEEKALRRKALKGDVVPDDVLKNLSAYNLIRNEGKEYKTNNALLDALLEGSVILPKSEAKSLVEFIQTNTNEIAMLNEETEAERRVRNASEKDEPKFVTLDQFLLKDLKNIDTRKQKFDSLRGYDPEGSYKNKEYLEWEEEKEDLDSLIKFLEDQKETLSSTVTDAQLDDERDHLDDLEYDLTNLKRANPKNDDLIHAKERDIKLSKRKIDSYEKALSSAASSREQLMAVEKELRDANAKKRKLELREPEQKKSKGTYNRLTTTSILVDREQLQKSLDSSLGELLLNENNKAIRDRFEKATFLLQANRIAGLEYIEYVTQRLGMPIPKNVRQDLVKQYKIQDIIDTDQGLGKVIRKKDIKRIEENRKITTKVMENMFAVKVANIVAASAIGAGVGAAVFAGQSGLAALGTAMGAVATAAWLPAVVGLGAFGSVLLIKKLIDKHRGKKQQKLSKLQGWERVESLIFAMEDQQAEVRKLYVNRNKSIEIEDGDPDTLDYYLKKDELNKVLDDYSQYVTGIASRAKPKELALAEDLVYNVKDYESLLEDAEIISEYINASEEHTAALLEYNLLNEAKVQTTIPVGLELKYEYDTKKTPDVLVAPKFSTRSQYAYGSVEYDKRELKDRKYNAPLLMTVNFKERFSDGTFSDNELTAVIGILGVITRVPSKEMEYILTSSAKGSTIKGIFQQEGDPSKLVSNILGIDKIKKDVKNLPQSADVWQNLEKISRLAISNRLAGSRSNNIANAHIIFAQKEIDNVRGDENIDYLKNIKLVAGLMKRYSAFTVMVANDISERLYIFDDANNTSWDIVPYSAFRSKDTGDQLSSMLNKMSSGRL